MATPLDELDIHTQLMEKQNKVVEASGEATKAALEAVQTLSDHNQDAEAHPDIRRLIESAGNVSSTTLEEKIEQHDTSSSAHADLFAEVNAKIENALNSTEAAESKIAEHNTSDTAHADIRASVSELNLRVGELDLTSMNSDLTSLTDKVNGSITDSILALQSVDAKHDKLIAANERSIKSLTNDVKDLSEDVDLISTSDFVRQADLDKLILRDKEFDVAFSLKYNTGDNPNFIKLSHTLPTYVGRNKLVVFKITDITASASSNVTLSLEVGDGDFQISPTTNVALGSEISIQTGSNSQPGDVNWFSVTATDNVTGEKTKRAIAFMTTRPLDLKYVSIRNLPDSVEPGTAYGELSVRNLAASRVKARWTYTIKPLTSELLFDPIDLNTDQNFNLTVPSHVNRNQTVTFRLTIHDAYGDDQYKDFSILVNALPGTEDFTCNIPQYVVPGNSYPVKFAGIKSINGVDATYAISDPSSYLVFSKTTGILANENVTVSVSENAPRGSACVFTVTSTDENNVSLTTQVSCVVNTRPTATSVLTNLPDAVNGGTTTAFVISGGSDTECDENCVTYEIDGGDSGFIFDVTKNIKAGDIIHLSTSKVPSDTVKSFNIYTVDALNEKSEVPKQISLQVKAVYIPDAVTINSPSEGEEVNVNFTMAWGGWAQHTDI